MKKLLIIGSQIYNAPGHEWTVDYLNKEKYEIHFMLLNDPGKDSQLDKYLRTHPSVKFTRIPFVKKKDLARAFFVIGVYILRYRIKIIHTHLREASLVGLLAAYLTGVKKRIHTRHHTTYNHVYFPSSVKYDKFINALSSHIVAVSKVTEKVLTKKEGCSPEKVSVVHHGFDPGVFEKVSDTRVNKIKNKYSIKPNRYVVGVVSRYTQWKGIQYIIPAFERFLLRKPDACLVLANARGDYEDQIKKLLKKLPEQSYIEIDFEEDNAALFKCFDLFIHVPIDHHSEAFGQIYVEAMLAKVPSIFTLSGIANEFVLDQKNAIIVDYGAAESVYDAMILLSNDIDLASSITVRGFKDACEQFHVQKMIDGFEAVYD